MISALEHFAPHHQELRQRLVRCVIAVLLASAAAYFWIEPLMRVVTRPLFTTYPPLQHLVYTNLTEAFVTYLKFALLAGLGASFPVVLHQVWGFVAPGLLPQEKKVLRRVVFWGSSLFAAGVLFAYCVALPRILGFFMSYAGPTLVPLPKLGAYLTFVARMLLAFGLAFQIPFLMVTSRSAGIVSRNYFTSKRRFFYIAISVLAFLLAAGDLTATTLLCLPLIALYETGILAGRVFDGKTPTPEPPENSN